MNELLYVKNANNEGNIPTLSMSKQSKIYGRDLERGHREVFFMSKDTFPARHKEHQSNKISSSRPMASDNAWSGRRIIGCVNRYLTLLLIV